jgi:hypothetical protein
VGQAGDRLHDHGPPPSGAKLAGGAGDLDDLRGMRKAEVVDGGGFEGAQLDPAVGAVTGAVQEPGLVGLDDKQVVGLLAGDQELGGARVVCSASAVTVGQLRAEHREQLGGAASDRQLGLQLRDPAACRHQVVVLVAAQARQQALVDAVLATPGRDRLGAIPNALATSAIGRPASTRSRTLRRNSGG